MNNHKQKNSKNLDDTIEKLLLDFNNASKSQDDFSEVVNKDVGQIEAETRRDNSVRDNKHRSKIALIVTWSFVILVGIIVVLGPVFNATLGKEAQIDVMRLLEAFNSIFGAVLGFVLGYYFKDKGDWKK